MKNILAILSIIAFIASCNQPPANDSLPFDKVEHYSIEITEDKLWEIFDKKNRSAEEDLLISVVINNTPSDISDLAFIPYLKKIGFESKEIDKSKFKSLSTIFKIEPYKQAYARQCIAEYRDLLIFKKNDEVIGIAKICFGCSQKLLISSNNHTMSFDKSGAYQKLANLLEQ